MSFSSIINRLKYWILFFGVVFLPLRAHVADFLWNVREQRIHARLRYFASLLKYWPPYIIFLIDVSSILFVLDVYIDSIRLHFWILALSLRTFELMLPRSLCEITSGNGRLIGTKILRCFLPCDLNSFVHSIAHTVVIHRRREKGVFFELRFFLLFMLPIQCRRVYSFINLVVSRSRFFSYWILNSDRLTIGSDVAKGINYFWTCDLFHFQN